VHPTSGKREEGTSVSCHKPFSLSLFSLALHPSEGYGLLATRGFLITHNAPLDEWSARRRDLYLTTHNKHNRQTSVPPVGFESMIAAGERPYTYALHRAAAGTGFLSQYQRVIKYKRRSIVWVSTKRLRRLAYCVCGMLQDQDTGW
jgi:hypothetical protein